MKELTKQTILRTLDSQGRPLILISLLGWLSSGIIDSRFYQLLVTGFTSFSLSLLCSRLVDILVSRNIKWSFSYAILQFLLAFLLTILAWLIFSGSCIIFIGQYEFCKMKSISMGASLFITTILVVFLLFQFNIKAVYKQSRDRLTKEDA